MSMGVHRKENLILLKLFWKVLSMEVHRKKLLTNYIKTHVIIKKRKTAHNKKFSHMKKTISTK